MGKVIAAVFGVAIASVIISAIYEVITEENRDEIDAELNDLADDVDVFTDDEIKEYKSSDSKTPKVVNEDEFTDEETSGTSTDSISGEESANNE